MDTEQVAKQHRDLDILTEIQVERKAQDARWGVQDHPSVVDRAAAHGDTTFAAVHHGIREAYKAKDQCARRAATGTLAWADILVEEVSEAIEEACDGDSERLEKELIQVAAVAAAWVENIRRRRAAANGG